MTKQNDCKDYGVPISPRASYGVPLRCKSCQNNRADLKAQRTARQQATVLARHNTDELLPNAGRRRAQKIFEAGPCSKCGNIRGVRHHIDGDTFNNVLENILVLCQSCHAKLHYTQGDMDISGLKYVKVRGVPTP